MNPNRRILLGEDDPQDRELTLKALADAGVGGRVDVATDGADVLDYLHCRGRFVARTHALPAFLILDLKMPKVDGIEVIRQIREDQTLHTLPIVVLSSSREERDLIACYRLGVNGYVVKSMEFTDHLRHVRLLGEFWGLVNEPPPETVHKSP
jgi:CheY-like chemotaxis protein